MSTERVRCPACAQATLRRRGVREVCSVCGWEDDGRDDVDAHLPDDVTGETLWGARASAVSRGVAAAGRFRSVGDVVVDVRSGDDTAPWEWLQDGVIAGVVPHAERVTVMVEIGYLRRHLRAPGPALRVELFDCDEVVYTPYEGWPVDDLDVISGVDFDIAEAGADGQAICVFGSRGQLRLRYGALGLRFGDGSPVSLAALDAASRAYWDEWRRRW